MKQPSQFPLIEGEIADYRFDEVAGILYAYSKNPRRTVENIRANITLVKKITQNRKVPLLIYLCNSPVPDKATRKYSTEQLPNVYTAMAMVSPPGLAKFIMNILFRLKKPPIPIRSFSDEVSAKNWLLQTAFGNNTGEATL